MWKSFKQKKKEKYVKAGWEKEWKFTLLLWRNSCMDCGWTGLLSCCSQMDPDRAISHAEIYLSSFQQWEDESERPFPLSMNIYPVKEFTGFCME